MSLEIRHLAAEIESEELKNFYFRIQTKYPNGLTFNVQNTKTVTYQSCIFINATFLNTALNIKKKVAKNKQGRKRP